MAMPSTAITRLDLSGTFSEFDLEMSRRGFIAPRVLRPRMVGIQASDVGKIPLAALLQDRDDSRAAGAGYGRSSWKFDKFSYATDEHGWEEALDDSNVAVFKDLFDAENIASQRSQDVVMRGYERAVASLVYDPSVWTGAALTTAIVNEWDDKTNATPIDDVEGAKRKVRDGSGLEPNAVILNSVQAWNAANCNQMLDRIKYSDLHDAIDTSDYEKIAALLALAWAVKYVLIAGGHRNTANAGQAVSISRIWSDEYVQVARVAETDDPREACIGRTFMWSEDGASAPGTEEEIAVLVEEYREEARRGGVVRARTNYDTVIMYAAAGHLLSNVTT